ncbi:hypothetical protein WA577_002943 [Blastocystis sp. JDR]
MSSWQNPTSAVSLIDYPPLYSLQAKENKEAQYRVWTDLIIAYTKSKKMWSISLQAFPLFSRPQINRDAPMELRKEIIEYMKDHGRALWIGSSQRLQAYILRDSVNTWVDTIVNSLREKAVTNPVQSHELVEDVDYTGDAFYGMPDDLMEMLLQQAVKSGKMVSFKTGDDVSYKLVSAK